MWDKTKTGWLMALTHSDDSNWGDVLRFYEDIRNSPRKNGLLIVDSDVWGKHLYKDHAPASGEGLAFYHSTRAKFSEPDPCHKRPRISLVGEILEVEGGNGQVDSLVVAVDEKVLAALERCPIVKTKETDNIFHDGCRIGAGPVATYYPANAETWKRILELVRAAMS